MSSRHTVLVTGATGKQGGAVADALLARGHKVRAFTRNPQGAAARALAGRGAEIAGGSFDDPASVIAAARGADAAFLMGNFYEAGYEGEVRQGKAGAEAIKAAGVGHLIYSSVGSADRKTGIPHFESKFEIERHIAGLGIGYTISAPVAFMENAIGPWTIETLRSGVHSFLAPADTPLQVIATADLGAFVASLIERRESVLGQRYDVAGDALTGDAQAAILSEAIGKPIVYRAVTPEMVRAQSADQALMAEWFEKVGYSADIPGLRRAFPEVGWHSYAQWANSFDWSVLAPERERA